MTMEAVSNSPEPRAVKPGSRALMIVAHGDCGGDTDNLLARELARRMRHSGRYDEVAVGYLRSEPTIEQVAAGIGSESIRLYPLFLSDGYYVRDAIPKRLGFKGGFDARGRHVTIDVPLGLHPGLPALLANAAKLAGQGRGIQPEILNVLLVAHGSTKSPHSADVARKIAAGIADAARFASIDVCFLDEPPKFEDAVISCAAPTLVMGLFAGTGMHAKDDVAREVARLNRPGVFAVEQLGGYANIIELIHAGLACAIPP